jgi:hypothetical protein
MSGTNPNAWHNFYHCVGGTYGTWLRGDPRGFRTWQHKHHVHGDYKTPPPQGVYDLIFEYTQKKLKHPPTKLNTQARQIACKAMTQRFKNDAVELIAIAVAFNHFHLLARFIPMDAPTQHTLNTNIIHDGRDPAPRHDIGRAKQAATYALGQHGLKSNAPIWAQRPTCKPIHSREHQIKTARYIKNHLQQGAAVWHIKLGFLFDADQWDV